jgi:hypothetical protein
MNVSTAFPAVLEQTTPNPAVLCLFAPQLNPNLSPEVKKEPESGAAKTEGVQTVPSNTACSNLKHQVTKSCRPVSAVFYQRPFSLKATPKGAKSKAKWLGCASFLFVLAKRYKSAHVFFMESW